MGLDQTLTFEEPHRGRWGQLVMAGSYPVTMALCMLVLWSLAGAEVPLTLAA